MMLIYFRKNIHVRDIPYIAEHVHNLSPKSPEHPHYLSLIEKLDSETVLVVMKHFVDFYSFLFRKTRRRYDTLT